MVSFRDDFDGDRLDLSVWDPHYLPQWGTRAGTGARYDVSAGRLRLVVSVDQPLWCPDQHEEPLRVSGIASGGHSGPLGSAVGGQPFHAGQTVREKSHACWGGCRTVVRSRSAAGWTSLRGRWQPYG